MNKIILFFNKVSTRVATARLAKLAVLAKFDTQGTLLDLADGNIDVAYSRLVDAYEPKLLMHHQLEA